MIINNKKIYLSVIILLFLSLIVSLFILLYKFSNLEYESDKVIILNQKFYYCIGTSADTTKDATDYHFQYLENQENFEVYFPDTPGFLWIKFNFDLPGKFRNKELNLLLGRIGFSDETFLNGYFINKDGKHTKNPWNAWNQYRNYYIPKILLEEKNIVFFLLKMICICPDTDTLYFYWQFYSSCQTGLLIIN